MSVVKTFSDVIIYFKCFYGNRKTKSSISQNRNWKSVIEFLYRVLGNYELEDQGNNSSHEGDTSFGY